MNAQEAHALAQSFRRSGDLASSLAAAQRCVDLAPQIPAAWATLGVAQMELGQLGDAEYSFRKALSLAPTDPAIQFNLGETLLLGGKFEQAWPYFEAGRLVGNAQSPIRWPKPEWDGSQLDGRSILIYADGGFGDTIMFYRYLSLLRQRGAGRVSLLCQPELAKLLGGVDQELPPFDLQAPMMSLPRLFGTTLKTIRTHVPDIRPDPACVEFWHRRVEPYKGLRLGLVWAGRSTHVNDSQRSLPPELLQSFVGLPGVTIFSLQKDRPAGPKEFIDFTSELRDFSDSAALVANLDLIVSVDTSIAHLGGAMGKAVWLMLPFAPDWRWMLKRDDSPWYPTMRLFRQEQPMAWRAVVDRVISELRAKSEPPSPHPR